MTKNIRWHSAYGFFIDIMPEIHTVKGTFFLPLNLISTRINWTGVLLDDKGAFDLAFIINWDTKKSNSYTAFNGKINNEGNLHLDWLLSSEDLSSALTTSTIGSSILTNNNNTGLKTDYSESQHFPYPSELQNTPLTTDLFHFNKSSLFL